MIEGQTVPLAEGPLAGFLAALRHAGLTISPASSIDAYEAVAAVGYGDREILRDALCVTLAKSELDEARFEQCFDRYFSHHVEPDDRAATPRESAPTSGGGFAQLMLTGDAVLVDTQISRAARSVGVREVQYSFQRNILVGRILRELGMPEWDREVAQRVDAGTAEDLAEWQTARDAIVSKVKAVVDRQIDLYASNAAQQIREERLADMDIAAIRPEDRQAAIKLVRKMAKALASQHSRRRKRARRGQLDMRKTMRQAMPHEGIPFQLSWKQKSVDRPKFIVLCDVSRSVVNAAQFLLVLMYSLNEVVDQLHAFAFSDRLEDVGRLLDDNDIDVAIERVLREVGFGSTSYGDAFADFAERYMPLVDRHTSVIILGDGRNNYGDPQLDILDRIRRQARRVVWLNPEAERSWGTGDSEMPAYRRFSSMARTCGSLNELQAVIGDMLRGPR
ncbi:VWA domain-containing protein [Henriciella sp. AS95]|uniref:vWA domain-containing protein n=1 Tax=Henriciella sp. AS95 TaxID=3135782 RepID=UPI0031781A8E